MVASSVKEVYHWLGGGPRHGDSAIVYNRRNPNGLGDGGQLFMHLGYNGWQGDPRQVGMRPLSHDHPSRAEYWLNDQGGDWWIAEPVFVPRRRTRWTSSSPTARASTTTRGARTTTRR